MRQRQILGLLLFVLLLGAGSSWAQTADQKQVYEAYVKRDEIGRASCRERV